MESREIAYLIDANVCVGFFDQDDNLHAQAAKALKRIRENRVSVILFDHVLQEALTVLLYAGNNDAASFFATSAFAGDGLNVIDTPSDWIQQAVNLAEKQNYRPKMSTIDWMLLARSNETGIPILTFDKQLLAAAKKL